MAGRPPKESIDYAGWAVDLFDNDPKIDKLLAAQNAKGFFVYFYFCQKAYGSNGYFYPWSYDDAATTEKKIGGVVGFKTIIQVVDSCLQIGLFNERLFVRDGILTSRGIQKRYWQVAKDRTVKSVIRDYWLLSEEESAGVIFRTENPNYERSKLNYQPPKLNYERQKESKGKESINNDDVDARGREEETEITPEYLFSQYFGGAPAPAEREHCTRWLVKHGAELVEQAFNTACMAGQKNLAYVRGIFNRYEARDIHDLGDVAEDDLRYAHQNRR